MKKRAVMIMFDTLTREFLPNFGNEWIHAPNFKRLQSKMMTFNDFYAGSMPCMPARREIQTGRYNFLHRGWGQLESFDDSVFERLKENDIYCHLVTDHSHYFEDGGGTYHNRYSTWEGFRGQEADPWMPAALASKSTNEHPMSQTQGYFVTQHFANRTRQLKEEDFSSVKTIDAGLTFLKNYVNEDRWFLQIECFDPHEPFYVPEKYRKLYDSLEHDQVPYWPAYQYNEDVSDEDQLNLRKEYAALISMCDFHLGKLIDFFDEHQMWEDTLIMVNTDHGFLLGEYNWYGKSVMYQEVIHTPFFMHVPEYRSQQGQSIEGIGQTIDIPVTLLDYFEVKDTNERDGKSLLNIINQKENHESILFGVNGGHVCIYDGRYIYMRASIDPSNGPMTQQTLTMTQMTGFYANDFLKDLRVIKGNRFTNGYPVLEMDFSTYIDSYSMGHLLFDMSKDPKQERPLNNPEIEEQMVQKLKEKMHEIEAPLSEFIRLGLNDNKENEKGK